eukprot:scaffold170944_cov17-Tisochrysis_lutea.AAC.1
MIHAPQVLLPVQQKEKRAVQQKQRMALRREGDLPFRSLQEMRPLGLEGMDTTKQSGRLR